MAGVTHRPAAVWGTCESKADPFSPTEAACSFQDLAEAGGHLGAYFRCSVREPKVAHLGHINDKVERYSLPWEKGATGTPVDDKGLSTTLVMQLVSRNFLDEAQGC